MTIEEEGKGKERLYVEENESGALCLIFPNL